MGLLIEFAHFDNRPFPPIVVKAEYYWGTKCWWIFGIGDIGGIAASLSVDNILVSSLLGVFAFLLLTIKEVFELGRAG